jgi:hypothetical protein
MEGRRWAIEVGLIVPDIPDMDCLVDGLFEHSTNTSSSHHSSGTKSNGSPLPFNLSSRAFFGWACQKELRVH